MKKIRVTQNSLGRFYLGETTKQHSFVMRIEEDGKSIEIDGHKAVAQFIIPEEEHEEYILRSDDFTNLSDHFEEILGLCAKYSIDRNSGSKNEFFSFLKAYKENFEEVDSEVVGRMKEGLEKKIKEMKMLLKVTSIIPDPENTLNYIGPVKNRLKTVDLLISSYSKDLEEIKEGSEYFKKMSERIQKLEEERKQILEILKIDNEE